MIIAIVIAAQCLVVFASAEESVHTAPEIQVIGTSPEAYAQASSANRLSATTLTGRRLDSRKKSTLGETLSREAGVTSSFFGPNASRPVIRGLEGERVRVLQNGVGTLDASGASPDHAVPVDPFLTEKIEILRGPATLLYGSGAIGGVINAQNSRIPTQLEPRAVARVDSQFSSVDLGRSIGATAQVSHGPYTYHLDGVLRASEDYGVPGGYVLNSAGSNQEGAFGAATIRDFGSVGASVSAFHSLYGTVAEPDVTIDLQRQRLDLSGEVLRTSWARSIRFRVAGSLYKHQELEDGSVGTTFLNRGVESRLEIKHQPFGIVEGTWGLQAQYFNFQVSGDEAYLPTTHNASVAAFFHEALKLGPWTPSLGIRLDNASVDALENARFGPAASKVFFIPSAALGVNVQVTEGWTLGLDSTLSQRAPNYQELFANGPHLATGTFELGDRSLKPEVSRSLELSLVRNVSASHGRFGVFLQDFPSFIGLLPTGGNEAETGLPMFQAASVHALLWGAELEYRQPLPWTVAGGTFEAEFRFDWVRGQNLTAQAPLPRITPVRETVGLHYRADTWSSEIELQRSEAQSLTAPGETATPSYMMVNLGAEIPIRFGFGSFTLVGKIQNLFDALARNHVSFLKDRAPLQGRNFVIALRGSF